MPGNSPFLSTLDIRIETPFTCFISIGKEKNERIRSSKSVNRDRLISMLLHPSLGSWIPVASYIADSRIPTVSFVTVVLAHRRIPPPLVTRLDIIPFSL